MLFQTHRLLLYSRSYIALLSLIILMLELVQIWPVRAPTNCSSVLLICLYHSLGISHFLVQQDVLGALCAFLAPVLDSLFFLGALVPFTGEWYFKAKMWVIGVLIATNVSLVLDHLKSQISQTELGNMCMYTMSKLKFCI